MRHFSKEFGHSYETYSFGYCNYVEYEAGDTRHTIYASGFLPFSGNLKVKNTFYMARSARVNLSHFELTSENRRIAKKHESNFTKERIPFADFDSSDETFLNFCLGYFEVRHGGVMPKERLAFILSLGLISHIVVYKKDDRVAAYVFEVSDEEITHFWYSFYDLAYLRQSLGLWLMLDSMKDAKEREKSHFYLGTAYGEKGLYKTNFEPLEFWNGEDWIEDSRLLRELCRKDG